MALTNGITRRELLVGSLQAGVASVLLPRLAWSADPPIDPNRFVMLADIHLSQDPAKIVRNTNPDENFQQAREQYMALNPRPAGLIVAGDCAYNQGEIADYRRLRELVSPITIPITFAMGNHDKREHFWTVFPEQQAKPSPVPGRQVTVVEAPLADWFVLDSLDKTNSTPGRLGEAQIKWLAEMLDRHPDKPAIVVAHHYPLTDPTKVTSALLDTNALYDVIVPRKRVKAFIFAHSHRWSHAKHEGLHLVNLAALAWLFDPTLPRGWHDAQLKSDGMRLTLNCLDTKHPAHGQSLELDWR